MALMPLAPTTSAGNTLSAWAPALIARNGREDAGIGLEPACDRPGNHGFVAVGRDDEPAARLGYGIHLLGRQHGARADGSFACQRLDGGTNGLKRKRRVERYLDEADARVRQLLGDGGCLGCGDAPQNRNEMARVGVHGVASDGSQSRACRRAAINPARLAL
jgi:hypothetical protein